MTDARDPRPLEEFLAGAKVDGAVAALRPDYRALLIAVEGIAPSASDAESEALLVRAETVATELLSDRPAEEVPHVAAWREAYRAFGAKPQGTRNSLEALLRRAGAGLPRLNRLTDIYNAISVIHRLPLGGEDLDRYAGPPRLVRATGAEAFDTITAGDVVNAIYYFTDRKSVAQLGRFPQHREAKGQVQRWYDGYRIVVSDIRATYGDGRLPAPASARPSADQEQP